MKLGSITFQDFEVPSGINFGGRQAVAVHRLSSGRRVVDTLGPDATNITFSGAFSGPDALQRARSVDALRRSGTSVGLSWDNFYYTTIVSRFTAIYENQVWIPYQVVCTVVQDASYNDSSAWSTADDGLAVAMLTAASSILQLIPSTSSLAVGLGSVDAGVVCPSITGVGSSDLAAASTDIDQRIATSESQLNTSGQFQSAAPATAVAALNAAGASTQAMSSLAVAQSYLGASENTSGGTDA